MNHDVDILERWLLVAKGKRQGKKLAIVAHPSERNTWVVKVRAIGGQSLRVDL